ncbi:hypothetical protein [uncultured Microbacterium sp.]|uniref:hypothetical protein n=1 Tax=uncultured Microbacterium sp. TaxID=191216 RepID=UPI002618F8F0|nr:hypothetical protein [uncultured Microbacterium sp.]
MSRFRPAVLAAAVLALEGAALIVIAVLELFALGEGDASSTASGLALIALTLVGAAGLIAFAVGTLRHASWARSGGIVLQVLAIALALAALSSIRPVPWLFVLVLGLAGAVGLVALIVTVRREGADDPRLHRREDGTGESEDA